MTVKKVLSNSAWNTAYLGNSNWKRFINEVVGNWKTLPFGITQKNLSYYELCQKTNGVMRVFQDGKYCNFNKMNPCQDALVVHFWRLPLAKAEIFEYRQKFFKEVIITSDRNFLMDRFEYFNIFTDGGKNITDATVLPFLDECAIGISKEELKFEGPHIVIRYITPTVSCKIDNH